MEAFINILQLIIALLVMIGYIPLCIYAGYSIWKLGSTRQKAVVVGLLSLFFTPVWALAYIFMRKGWNRYLPDRSKEMIQAAAKRFYSLLTYSWRHRVIRYGLIICGITGIMMVNVAIENMSKRDEFTTNRESIMEQVSEAHQTKQYGHVVELAEPYVFIGDSELNAMFEEAVLAQINAVTGETIHALKRKKELYTKLSESTDAYQPQEKEVSKKIRVIEQAQRDKQRTLERQEELKRERAERDKPVNARYQCRQAVKAQSKFPSKVDFVSGRTNDSSKPVTVSGVVNLMNGFGAMIPHTYFCRFEGSLLAEVTVKPGG